MKDRIFATAKGLAIMTWHWAVRFVGNFTLTTGSKREKGLSLLLTAALAAFICFNYGLFVNNETRGWGWKVFAAGLFMAVLCGLVLRFNIKPSEKYKARFYTVLFFLMPVSTLQMVECYNGNYIYVFNSSNFWLNYLAYLFLYLVLWLVSSRFKFTILLVNIALYIFGMLNYFVDLFRGTPFVPMDIFSAGTGMHVAAAYNYQLSWQIIMATMFLILILLLCRRMVNIRPVLRKSKIALRVGIVAYVLIICSTLYGTDVLANHGYKPDFWDQSRGYHNSGTWYNFCLNTKYLHVAAPEGYNADQTESIVYDALADAGVDPESDTSINIMTGQNDYTPSGQHPNIIAIMNESFADLGTLGDLKTNKDYMPFIHSLTENTIKGTLQAPVFGAGTSNTEFEFLTGDSLSSLPAGSSVYESYIQHAQPSLVSTLSAQGYSKTALHPYYADGWNRPNVYNYMGFSNYISMEDIIDSDIVQAYKKSNDSTAFIRQVRQRYPDRPNMLLRRYISDAYDFSMVEDLYSKRDPNQPFFLFNVTMQNHGGYDVGYPNFTTDVHITNMTRTYPKAERYLSLVRKSDEAFQQLVDYFSQQSEPTIILMFGDHQPSVERSFYEELYKTSLDTLSPQQSQQRYQTPFIIWANYDIPEAQLGQMSANYLSTLLLQVAGQDLTDYNKYLAALYQKLPVIDTIGYVDRDGKIYSHDAKSDWTQTMADYKKLNYNNLIDVNHRAWSLYTLDGTPMEDPGSGDDSPEGLSLSE
jgi:phosphoglycerol transferase MdoB-like AlkP superfamily enzyme